MKDATTAMGKVRIGISAERKWNKKDDDHDADDDRLFEQVALQRLDGCLNQSRAVVSRDHFHARWQRRFDFREFLLDAIDDAQGIHSVAHHDNAANGFAFALPLGNTFANVRPERNCSQIADEHRRAVLGCDGNGFQVAQRTQIAKSANHVFGPAHFEHASTDFVRAGSHSVNHRRERNAVGAEFVGVEVDLVLANESADGGYLGHSGNSFELVAQIPVLKATQVGETVLDGCGPQARIHRPIPRRLHPGRSRDARPPAIVP